MAYTCLISFGAEYSRKLVSMYILVSLRCAFYHLVIPQACAGVARSTAAFQSVDGRSGREFRTVVRQIAEI